MKKNFLLLCLTLVSISLFSQDFSSLSNIELIKAEDYKPNESVVEECADYILSQPYKVNEQNKLYCIQFIIKWMEGTPDYSFSIGTDFVELCKDDTELSTVYLASLAKSGVDKNFEDKSSEALSSNAKELFLAYCAEPENKVKKNKAIKKALKGK